MVVLTRDLLGASHLGSARVPVRVTRSTSALTDGDVDLVIVDQRAAPEGWRSAVAGLSCPWVAVVSHVDDAGRDEALSLGARRVVTRSWLFGAGDPSARLERLLAGSVGTDAATGAVLDAEED